MKTVSALVAACHSAACRPPTSGGTGGSLSVQHVASKGNAVSIRTGGFRLDTPAWDRSFGDGVYFAHSGDEKSRKFYQRQGGRSRGDSDVIGATVQLKNPAEFTVKSHNDFRIQAAERLGGVKAVQSKAQSEYDAKSAEVRKILKEELGADAKKLGNGPVEDMMFWDVDHAKANNAFGRIERIVGGPITNLQGLKNLAQNNALFDKVPRGYSDQYGASESRQLANMLRDAGHDGLIINTPSWGGVGGNQVVVFDVTRIKVKS